MTARPDAAERPPRGLLLAGTVLAALGLLLAGTRLLLGAVSDALPAGMPPVASGLLTVVPFTAQTALAIGLAAVAVLLLRRSVPTRSGAARRPGIPLAVLLVSTGLSVALSLAQAALAAVTPDRARGAWASAVTGLSTVGTAVLLGAIAAWCLLALVTLGTAARLLPDAPPGLWFAATSVVAAERAALSGAVLLLAGLLTVRGDRPLRLAAWTVLVLLWTAQLVSVGAFAVRVLLLPGHPDPVTMNLVVSWLDVGALLVLSTLAVGALVVGLGLSGSRRRSTPPGTTPAAPSAAPLRPEAGPRG